MSRVKVDCDRLLGSGDADRLGHRFVEGVDADSHRSAQDEVGDSDHLHISIRFQSIERASGSLDFHKSESRVVNEQAASKWIDLTILQSRWSFTDEEFQFGSSYDLTVTAIHEGNVTLDCDDVADIDGRSEKCYTEDRVGIAEEDLDTVRANLDLFVNGCSCIIEAQNQGASGFETRNARCQSSANTCCDSGVGDDERAFSIDEASA